MANRFCDTCKLGPVAYFTFKGTTKVSLCEEHSGNAELLFPIADFYLMDSEADRDLPRLRRSNAEKGRRTLCAWREAAENETHRQHALIAARKRAYMQLIERICANAENEVERRCSALMEALKSLEQDLESHSQLKEHELAPASRFLLTDSLPAPLLEPIVWVADLPHLSKLFGVFSCELSNAEDLRPVRLEEACNRAEAARSQEGLAAAVESASLLALACSFLVPGESHGAQKLLATSRTVLQTLLPFAEYKDIGAFLTLSGAGVPRAIATCCGVAFSGAQSSFASKNYQEAEDLLRCLHTWRSAFSPDSVELGDTAHLLGLTLKARRQKRSAIPFFEEAVRIRLEREVPLADQAASLVGLGRCKKSTGQKVEALELYNRGKRLLKQANSAPESLAKVYYYISPLMNTDARRQRKCEKGIAIQKRVCPSSPQLADSYCRLAQLFQVQKRNGEALSVIQLATEIFKAYPEAKVDFCRAQTTLGFLYATQKLYQQAIDTLSLVLVEQLEVKDSRDIALACRFLGESHWALGNKQVAVTYMKKAQEHFRSAGDGASEREMQQQLARLQA